MVDLDEIMDTLIKISTEKLEILSKIYEITVEQERVVEVQNIEELNNLIDSKQTQIDDAQQLDVKFETIVTDLKTVYNINKLNELTFCKDKVEEIQLIIEKIMSKVKMIHELEVKNMDTMKQAKNDLESKINHANLGKKAISNYGNTNDAQQAIFFDKMK